MGQFSWFTQDTNHRIVNGEEHKVIMTDNNGRKYVEHCYEGTESSEVKTITNYWQK